MRYVSGLEKVQIGDISHDHGQDGIYPPGLNVGRWLKCGPDRDAGSSDSHSARRRLDRLKEVAVLLYRPPNDPEPDQALPNVEKKTVSSDGRAVSSINRALLDSPMPSSC